MGCFSLRLQKKIIPLLLLALSSWVGAFELEGIKFPATLKCQGKDLPLQGAGLRTATFLNIKVYVLAYYAEKKISGKDDPHLTQIPQCFSITYLKEFDNEDVDKAWAYQFKESSEFPYPTLSEHVKTIQTLFGEIRGSKNQSFTLGPESTEIYENGVLKGEIKGKEFQKNFLSLWFGVKPPSQKFQEALFKGVSP